MCYFNIFEDLWEKDLSVSWTEEEWEKLKKFNLSCSYNTAIREKPNVLI